MDLESLDFGQLENLNGHLPTGVLRYGTNVTLLGSVVCDNVVSALTWLAGACSVGLLSNSRTDDITLFNAVLSTSVVTTVGGNDGRRTCAGCHSGHV